MGSRVRVQCEGVGEGRRELAHLRGVIIIEGARSTDSRALSSTGPRRHGWRLGVDWLL